MKNNAKLPIEIQSDQSDLSSPNSREIENTLPYKTKKWAVILIYRLFKLQKNNAKFVKTLATLFNENYRKEFLEIFIDLLLKTKTHLITPKILLFSLKYLFFALKKEEEPEVLQNYENLLYMCFIPCLFISKSDEIIWNEDPKEYIYRYELDATFIVYKIKNLVLKLTDKFCKEQEFILTNFFDYIYRTLNQENASLSLPPNLILVKEAIFQIMGFLSHKIMKNNVLYQKADDILKRFALPDFGSQIGFLRVRACKIFDEFEFLVFKDKTLVNLVIENIANCLLSHEIPVQYNACIILKPLLEEKEVQTKLRPIVPKLFELTLKLMDSIDNEEVVSFLEAMIENFENDTENYALELLHHLTNAFFKYININSQTNKAKSKKKVLQEEETEMAANSCLEAMKTILFTKVKPEVYEKSCSFIIPLFNFGFKQEASDFLQNILIILSQIVKGIENLPDDLLFYFPVMLYMCFGIPMDKVSSNSIQNLNDDLKRILAESTKGWAGMEYLETMISAIAAFLSKLKETIFIKQDLFQNPFITLLIKLENEKNKNEVGEYEKLLLQHLYILILENCNEFPQEFFEFLIEKCLIDLKNFSNIKKMKAKSLETVIILSIFY